MLRKFVLSMFLMVAVAGCGAGATPTPEFPALTLAELFGRTEAAMSGFVDSRASGPTEVMADTGLQTGTMTHERTAVGSFRTLGVGEEGGFEFICVNGNVAARAEPDAPWEDQTRVGGSTCAGASESGKLPVPYSDDPLETEVVGLTELEGRTVYQVRRSHLTEAQPMPEPGKGSVVQMTMVVDTYVDALSFLVVRSVQHQTMPIITNIGSGDSPEFETVDQWSHQEFDHEYNVGVVIEWPEALGE